MKRSSTNTAVFLTISLLLASCSEASYKCTDPLGCLEISPGSPVIIGTILATNGQKGSIGTASLQSIQKATANRKLLGHPIALDSYVTDCSAESARTAATNLAIDPGVLAIIGPTCADETLVALPILSDAGIFPLSPVPDAAAAGQLTNQIITTVERVAIQRGGVLYIPRQVLYDALNISP
jgi:ABC-type branched-subunit amino acid transport system substrate-binding protein